MAQISLEVPNDTHLKVKQIQLDKEIKGEKTNLKEIYLMIINKGLEKIQEEKS